MEASSELREALALVGPEDHLKMLPKSHGKQTKARAKQQRGLRSSRRVQTWLGKDSATTKPALNPTTKPLFSGRGKPPHPEPWCPTCSISALFAKAPRKVTEKHVDVECTTETTAQGGWMDGWKPSHGQTPARRRPRGRVGSHPHPADTPSLAVSVPWSPPPQPSPSFSLGATRGSCLPSPPPSAFQLFFTALQGRWVGGREGGREGRGCFCLVPPAAAGYGSAPPPLPPASASPKEPGAGSCPEREDPRGDDAPDPGSVFTDSQNSLRNKL